MSALDGDENDAASSSMMRWVRCAFLACIGTGFLSPWVGCQPSYLPGLPPGSPFAEAAASSRVLFSEGIAIGDVSPHSALVWLRTDGPATVTINYEPTTEKSPRDPGGTETAGRPIIRQTDAARDYTLTVPVEGLRPATAYRVVITAEGRRAQGEESRPGAAPASNTAAGQFTTLPDASDPDPVHFGWSADLGGQAHCRHATAGYPIFDVVRQLPMQFFLLLGDTVYADEICPAPPNAPGSDFAAVSLETFRAKHRYQRADAALTRFLASMPVFVVWDDHEVRNNFSGPFDERMPAGREALFDYWPIPRDPQDPHRLYRRFRAGASVEIFLLDTRQYRSRNSDLDGPEKTMLGQAQLLWLLDGLRQSTATWKVIASTVPLSVPKGSRHSPGNDGWANGADGTGFETELKRIVDSIMSRNIRNVVWLAADVHYAQANTYDPDGDGRPDFHEFVAGPLSAASGRMVPPRSPFPMQNLLHEGGYRNFGRVQADHRSFEATIIDESGHQRFHYRIEAR